MLLSHMYKNCKYSRVVLQITYFWEAWCYIGDKCAEEEWKLRNAMIVMRTRTTEVVKSSLIKAKLLPVLYKALWSGKGFE